MSLIIYELEQLYLRTFGSKPYRVQPQEKAAELPGFTIQGQENLSPVTASELKGSYAEREVWLPIKFVELDEKRFGSTELMLPYAVVKISGKKTIVKTPLAERSGTVKELYSIDDYSIGIKGFLIDDKYRTWPENEIRKLQMLYEMNQAVHLSNALTNLFLGADGRVVIESLEFPEVEGGRKHIRPFSMTLESDSVFNLDL